MKHRGAGYALLIPAVVVYLLATVIPAFWVVRLSFYESNYMTERFIGLRNYVQTFADPTWWRSVLASLKFVMFIVPAQILIPLVFALIAVNEPKGMQSYLRMVWYLPGAVSAIILSNVWRWIFDHNYGIANYLLGFLGLGPVKWWSGQWSAIAAMSVIAITVSIGGGLIMYLAVMLSIDSDLYAAAQIDGASWWQIRWRIVMPMIMPTIALIALISLIGTMQLWYLPYLLTSGGPARSTETIMFNVFREGFLLSKYGLANARALMLVLLTAALALVSRRVSRG